MKREKNIKRVAFVAFVAFLALVFWCYWVSGRIERGEPQVFFSDGAVTAISIACTVLAAIAVGYAVFIVARAFYLGLTQPESKEKHDQDG
jgi:hypothetical protein